MSGRIQLGRTTTFLSNCRPYIAAVVVPPCRQCLHISSRKRQDASRGQTPPGSVPRKDITVREDRIRQLENRRYQFLKPSRNSEHEPVKPFTKEEWTELEGEYTPEQLDIVRAGEEAVARQHMDAAKNRTDMYALPYFTDLNTIDPFLDFPTTNVMPGNDPQQPVPQMSGDEFVGTDDEEGKDKLLSRMTGMDLEIIKEGIMIRPLVRHRVTNQTRLGKIHKQYVMSIAGDGNGLLGIGEGKAVEPDAAQRMADYQAVRNMKFIPRYERRTIFGNVKVKIGAVEIELMARPPGFGVRCSQYIFEIARCCGIKDLAARVTRSRNPMNVVKAVQYALMSQKLPETIARGRGKKLVDVRKTYYGASTY